MKITDENVLEPVVRYFRYKEGVKNINKDKPVVLVDFGAGPKIRFYNFALRRGVTFKQYIGIDSLIDTKTFKKYSKNQAVNLIPKNIDKTVPLENGIADYVVGFAFLEHLSTTENVISETIRILKPGGVAIFTTPTLKARGVLEFLSFKLGIISTELMKEHQDYFDKEKILTILNKYQNKGQIIHKYFELGLNNLVIYKKNP